MPFSQFSITQPASPGYLQRSLNGSGLIAEYLTVFVILAWPEVVLKPSRIHPLVRQGVAAGMAEHVHMDREGKPCGFASSFNQPGNAHPA